MNEGPSCESTAPAEFFDDRHRSHEILSLAPICGIDGDPAHAEIGQFSEEFGRESMFSVPESDLLRGHLLSHEALKHGAQVAKSIAFIGKKHDRPPGLRVQKESAFPQWSRNANFSTGRREIFPWPPRRG